MTVWLKHPYKQEPPIEVENAPEALVPLMVQGYVQVHPDHKESVPEEEN